MKIVESAIFNFRLPLIRPLTLKGQSYSHRDGVLLRLQDDNGNTAWGEISPLPGFSAENIISVGEQLQTVRSFFEQLEVVPEKLERLDGGFDTLLGSLKLSPSVRFGVETAILQLLSIQRQKPLRKILVADARDVIPVNGLLSGTETEIMDKTQQLLTAGYETFKLKVGQRPLREDITITRWLRETVGPKAVIRLDANRKWNLENTFAFAREVRDINVAYIEEPVRNYLEILQLLNKGDYPLPLALDESLTALKPEAFPSLPGVQAIVIKPTLHGFERSMRFARIANRKGMTAVISSSFESNIGLAYLAELAACVNRSGSGNVACGLNTADWFAENVQPLSLPINKGTITLPPTAIAQPDTIVESITEPVNE